MQSLLQSYNWARDGEIEGSTAALDFHHAAARDPALQSFISETLVLLCADLMAGRCDLVPQEAAQKLDRPSITIYCIWIKIAATHGDWTPAGLRALYSPQGLVSCLAPFVSSAPGASPSFTATAYSALMVADMVRGDAPGAQRNPICPSIRGVDRAVTEQLVLGMVRQAAALLQLRRLPAVKRLAAAQKAATAGFLQVCPGVRSEFLRI